MSALNSGSFQDFSDYFSRFMYVWWNKKWGKKESEEDLFLLICSKSQATLHSLFCTWCLKPLYAPGMTLAQSTLRLSYTDIPKT